MGIYTLIISLILLILSFWIKKDKICSPIKLFYFLWTFIILLSNIHITGLYTPSDFSYLMITTMLIFFFIGFLTVQLYIMVYRTNSNQTSKKIRNEKQISINWIIYYILCAIVVIINIIDCIIVLKFRKKGIPMWQIRNWILQPYGSSNPILDKRTFAEDCFRKIIMGPFSFLIYPIGSYTFFYTKSIKQKYINLSISILFLLTSAIGGAGGRLTFITFVSSFIFMYFIWKKNSEDKKNIMKIRKTIFCFGIFAVMFIIILTSIRSGFNNVIIEAYKYFALPPTLLSVWLEKIRYIEHSYGLLSFFGVYSYLFRIIGTIIGNKNLPLLYKNTFNNILNAENFMDVGLGNANAFVTPIYYFWIDGGIIGVIVLSYIFGALITFSYEKRMNNYINIRDYMIYYWIMYGVFVSFMRIQTAIPSFIISYVLIFLITKNKIGENNDKKSFSFWNYRS